MSVSLRRGCGSRDLDELNAWLLDKCITYAKAHRHPELTEQTIWEVFEAERPKLVRYTGRFDGFHSVPASVSKTCLVRFDNNKYSVAASAVRTTGRSSCLCGSHCNPPGRADRRRASPLVRPRRHALRPLALRPGARTQARRPSQRRSLQDWVLPASMERVRRKLAGADDGNRQMVDILTAVLTDGLPAVEAACAGAITHSGAVPPTSSSISLPASAIPARPPPSSRRLR